MASTAVAATQDLPHTGDPARPSWWKWAIVLTASLGAVMEIIDTSIVNVALNDMQGNLGATLSEIGWVVTGYAMANVIIIPLSAWLGQYFGKKNYFVFSLIGFTLASILCGMATSLPMLIVSRILQGLTGGGLLAKAQAIIFETFPKNQQSMAQAIFGMSVMVGPAIGPVLGGYITDNIGWRWIFFINIPVGILAVLAALIFFPKDNLDPKRDRGVDWWGIFFLTMGLGCLQVMLEEGNQDDWFSSPFIIAMAALSLIGLVLFIWQEMTVKNPAVNLRVLRYPSLAAGCVFSVILGVGLYGAIFALPIFAQQILQFTATKTGLMLLPGALASAAIMIISAQVAKKIDPRFMIALGALTLAGALFAFSNLNIYTGEDALFWPNFFRGTGTVLMFMPLSLATFGPIPKQDIAAASGLFNLTRQMGGSIGIAALTTILAQRENFHRSNLVEHFNILDPMVRQRISMMTGAFMHRGSEMAVAKQQAFGAIDGLINQQAAILSFADIFRVVGFLFIAALALIFFLGRKQSPEASMEVH